jgi:NitT/TauT family transport system substrate-binding protein
VRNLLAGHVAAVDWVNDNQEDAKRVVNGAIEELTGKALADETINAAWPNLEFTVDPIASSLKKSAQDAVSVQMLDPVELDGIYSLDLLNEVLESSGKQAVGAL